MAEAANISTTALRKKIIHVSIVGILLAAILVGVATMVPSFNRLVDAHNEELAHSAELLAQSLDQFVNHSKAIATQSVSQFQARQILVAHGFGDIGASQLRTLVVPVLRAIVEQHDSLLGIVRFDKANRAVVSAGIDIPDIQWPYGAFTSDTALIGQLHETARGLRFTVSIPIMDPNFGRIGTDILLLEAKELLRLLQPTRPSDDQETYLMVLSANGPLFVATSGFTRPEGLGEIDPSTLPDKGFVRVEDTEIGVASVAATGWRVLITTDSSRHDRHLWEDIAKTAFITLLVMAGVGSIVYALMAPLAKGLVVRAESLEAEVIQRTTELNASEERFRGFAEAASDWFWETDTEHRFTYLSAAFESASSHLSADQILGRKRWDIPGAAPVDGDWTEHRAGMDAHDPIVGFEYAIVGADGEKRFLRVNGKPRFDEDGTFLGYRGVGRNITDLRRAEREREKSEKLFLDAISSVPVSIALFDPNDRLVVWNRLYAREIAKGLELTVGISFEEVAREAIARGRVTQALEDSELWLKERLERHHSPKEPFELRIDGNDWEITEHRTAGDYTVLIAHDVTQMKRAESDLREQKDLLETVFESVPAAIFLKDGNGVFTECNEQFVRFRGLKSKHDVIGKTIFDFVRESREAEHAAEWDRLVMETGQPQMNAEETIKLEDGSYADVLSSKVPLLGHSGDPVGVLGIFTDISERKRTETALAESEARFRALIDHSPNAIFLKDREGRYLVANKTLADRCGTAIGNLIGKTAHDFFPTETAKQFETRERRVAKSGESRSDRQKAVFPDGKTRILNIVRFPVPGVDGRRTAMGCISQDITDQVRAEEALQEEHNLLQTVLENIPHAVYWKERNLTYAGCNSVYAKTWGLRRRDVIGKTFQDLSPNPQEADAIATLDRQVLSGRSLVDFEDTRTDPNGTVKVHLSSKVPLLDSLGRSRGVLGIFTDITERKRTEEILRRSQKLQSLGNLAGGMAHEINNLLLPITTLTQMTIKHMADGSAEQTRLKKVHEAAARAASIIRKVMEFTRQDTRDRKRMDPREIIERAIRIVSSTLPATVELQRQLARDIGRIEVNPDDFTVVISNLVANGVDALSGKPGNLRISLQKKRVDARHAASIGGLEPGKHALVRIADTGCGMPPETVRRAPDPFFTTKEVGEGSGLGLSVAHGIVERHGGAMHIASTPGVGTEVSIYLPLLADELPAGSAQERDGQSEGCVVTELERKYGSRIGNR